MTHKVITATYPESEHHFVVPKGWILADICIKHGLLYHKGVVQNVPQTESEDDAIPEDVREDVVDVSDLLECEEAL